jgi:hypothetical protein
MKIALIIFSGVLIFGVIIYSCYNRDSVRVILTLVTAMTIGALGFITKESISNKVEKVSKEFPVVVFFSAPNYRPVNIKLPYDVELSMCLQEIKQEDLPVDRTNIDIVFGQKKNYDALQYLLVKEFFTKFSNSWNVVAKQTQTPHGKTLSWQSLGDSGKDILLSDFVTNFPDNYFVKLGIHKNVPHVFGGKAVLPPGTKITVENDDSLLKTSINLSTDYIKVTINFAQSSAAAGLGEYSKLLGMTNHSQPINLAGQNQYGNATYTLEIKAEQTLWLNGHPDMKLHRNWAKSIIDLLDSTFNYELIREEHLRQFQIYGSGAIKSI